MFANGAPIALIIMIKYSQGWRGAGPWLGSLTYLDTLVAHESLNSTLKLSFKGLTFTFIQINVFTHQLRHNSLVIACFIYMKWIFNLISSS